MRINLDNKQSGASKSLAVFVRGTSPENKVRPFLEQPAETPFAGKRRLQMWPLVAIFVKDLGFESLGVSVHFHVALINDGVAHVFLPSGDRSLGNTGDTPYGHLGKLQAGTTVQVRVALCSLS